MDFEFSKQTRVVPIKLLELLIACLSHFFLYVSSYRVFDVCIFFFFFGACTIKDERSPPPKVFHRFQFPS